MINIDKVLDAFISGDFFIIFLILTLAVLLVLVLALIKTRGEYNELLKLELNTNKDELKDKMENIKVEDIDILDELDKLKANTEEDIMDENTPLIKQIDVSNVKTYDDVISDYEASEEENAVISSEDLLKKAKERRDKLGDNDNQIAIAKYEEEQEKKAIISYEQLLQNASNITLTYKKEDNKQKDAPKVNKVEIDQKEVGKPEIYLEQEEFLKILKEFRVSLNENIFN